MRYVSTAGTAPAVGFSAAMTAGLAPDGGLYVPEEFPRVDPGELTELALPVLARSLLEPFLVDDPLAAQLEKICVAAFDFPIPAVSVDGHLVLELFNGPTCAFKDVGARFFAECMSAAGGQRRVLVATSGDTGGAVAAACHGKPGLDVTILYPHRGVSPRQEHQLTCWGGNVEALAVRGVFDDCQRLVKQAFSPGNWPERGLTTANSINIARLLPQIVHHAVGALAALNTFGEPVDTVIPSGNLGNATAALWAKRMGLPIGRIVLATNANRTISEFFSSGRLECRPSVSTLANAMDVGDPSNLERVRHLYADHAALCDSVSAVAVEDEAIERAIVHTYRKTGRMVDPHTATAYAAHSTLPAQPRVLVSTAHPAKFPEVVEPLVGTPIEIPTPLADLLNRPARVREMDANIDALKALIARLEGRGL